MTPFVPNPTQTFHSGTARQPGFDMTIPIWIWILVVIACVIASYTDVKSTRIPNWLSLPVFLVGMLHAVWSGGLEGLLDGLGGAAIAGGLFIFAYAVHKGGGGDAKLMLGLGVWLGIDLSVILLAAVTAAGFLEGMIAIVVRGGIRDIPIVLLSSILIVLRAFQRTPETEDDPGTDPKDGASAPPRSRPKHWVPFAPAILAGTIFTWIWDATGGFS